MGMNTSPVLTDWVTKARAAGEDALRATLGPYRAVADAMRLGLAHHFVRGLDRLDHLADFMTGKILSALGFEHDQRVGRRK